MKNKEFYGWHMDSGDNFCQLVYYPEPTNHPTEYTVIISEDIAFDFYRDKKSNDASVEDAELSDYFENPFKPTGEELNLFRLEFGCPPIPENILEQLRVLHNKWKRGRK